MSKKKKSTRNWDSFCHWLLEYMELENTKATIEWEIVRIAPKNATIVDPLLGEEIIRIDLCKDKPFKVATCVPNKYKLCTREMAYRMSKGLVFALSKAIKNNSPMSYIPYAEI